MDRRNKSGGWYVDKSIPISTIVTAIALFCSGAGVYANFTTRMAISEATQQTILEQQTRILANQERVDARQDAELSQINRDIRDNYNNIDQKIQKLLERR